MKFGVLKSYLIRCCRRNSRAPRVFSDSKTFSSQARLRSNKRPTFTVKSKQDLSILPKLFEGRIVIIYQAIENNGILICGVVTPWSRKSSPSLISTVLGENIVSNDVSLVFGADDPDSFTVFFSFRLQEKVLDTGCSLCEIFDSFDSNIN